MNWINKYIKTALVILAFLVVSFNAAAQQVLTLNDALKMALENNYAIQVAKNEATLAQNNNRLGAAGMLPVVTGTVNQDNQVVNTQQKFLNGTENNKNGAKNNNLNANVELGWTIFDGLKMFAVKNRLEELQRIGELRMRANIEQTFVRVTKAYYDVLLAKQQLQSTTNAYANSKNRLDIANEKYRAGKSAKTELLKAQVDLNTDKALMMRQENALKNSKANLNQLLARDLNVNFEVSATNTNSTAYKLDDLLTKLTTQNSKLLVAKKTHGAGLSINLFNGFDVSKRLQNAKLMLKSNELIYKDSLTRLQNQVQQAYNNYMLSEQLVTFEKENVKVAQENFEVANEQYKVGVITSIELRDAQLNLLNSELRLFTAQYENKLNETELLRLTGDLVKL